MANTKISELAAASTLTGAELVPVVQGGTTKRTTVQLIGTTAFKFVNRTSGNITLNSTSWANVDTGMDLVLSAAVNDVIEVGIGAYVVPNSSIEYGALDVASIVSGSPVNYWSGGSTNGIPAWEISGSMGDGPLSGSWMKTIVSGDLSGGTVTLRLRYKTNNAVNHTLRANANDPLQFWAKKLGPAAA